MKTHVKALVVGGGAVGTGIAYHLAKAGWDTMLVERDELTSGSTWHAAGLLPLFNMSYATTHIHKYSVDFYKGLEAETGLNHGYPNTQSVNQPHNRLQAGDILTNIRLCKFKNNTSTVRFFALHQRIPQPALESGAN